MWTRFRTERGVLVYWALLGLGWSVHSYLRTRDQERRAVELELRSANLERELARAQLGNLQSHLHPHFLFNALHSVGGLVRNGEEQAALSTLSNVGGLLRSMLELGERTEVTLGEELELIERYLEVERIRLGDRLKVETTTEPGVAEALVPTLILLPLVENTIKHGIAPRREGGVLSLSARREGDQVVIEVCDDGPGFPPAVLAGSGPASERTPIGLSNTRERLAVHCGDAAALELENPAGGGARAVLRLPFRRAT
jgi:sensor histidine kinase YesM